MALVQRIELCSPCNMRRVVFLDDDGDLVIRTDCSDPEENETVFIFADEIDEFLRDLMTLTRPV